MPKEKMPISILNKMDDEYIKIVKEIITNPEFIKRRIYHHHENRSVYGHCLLVSIRAYYIARFFNLDYKSAAISGLLHDFYYNDWQLSQRKGPLFEAHGFTHAKQALENSKFFFPELMNKKVENAIKRHMFPLNIVPPLYLESWIICLVDKYCSFEIFKKPKNLYKYIGYKGKKVV
ncbi:MAG: phosphohydrolase [Bacilli bacterium]